MGIKEPETERGKRDGSEEEEGDAMPINRSLPTFPNAPTFPNQRCVTYTDHFRYFFSFRWPFYYGVIPKYGTA